MRRVNSAYHCCTGKGLFYCTGGTGGDEGVAGELVVERGDNGVGREVKEEVENKKEGGG